MRFNEYPILRLLISLVIGIFIAHYFELYFLKWYFIIPFLAMLSFLAFPRKYLFPYRYRYFSGTYVYLVFIILGILLTRYHSSQVNENYLGKYVNTSDAFLVEIIEPPHHTSKTVKLFVAVNAYKNKNKFQICNGKAVLYLQKDSKSLNLEYGDLLIINKALKNIPPPSSPDQFDYAAFLALQDIYYQQYIKTDEWLKTSNESEYSIIKFSISLRQKLLKILEQNNLHGDELSVAAGMLLGQRDLLSPELRDSYAGAGAMHILCVSGLHVGIIFLIINFLLRKLSNNRRDLVLKAFILLISIWFYALLTGLSPSVVRSATMFTFIIFGQNYGRRVNIIGSLSASALVLLVLNPNLLFDLGFQLSYSAVFSIVILQKHIVQIWTPLNGILYWTWQLISVSIAAQIGTAPFSIYYFHQFPNLFIITNIIVIPAAYIVITLGIGVLILSFIPLISTLLGKVLAYFLFGLNYAITYIEQLPYAVSRDLYISFSIFIILVLLIIFISIWLIKRKRKFILVNLSLTLILLIAFTQNYDDENEFIIYPDNQSLYMAVYSQRQAWIICDTSVYNNHDKMSFQVKEHELHKGIRKRNYILIDSLNKLDFTTFAIDFPYCQFGKTKVKLDGFVTADSLYQKDYKYIIYSSLSKNIMPNNDSLTQIVLCGNIPLWTRKKLIYKSKEESFSYFDIKKKGAWIIRF